MTEHRAYGLLTIKSHDELSREISGVMSTGETDRVGDQVMPMGVKARLPAPCLWQHDSRDPIGEIVSIDPKPDGIRFRAKLLRVDHPPSLKDKLDSYYALIKSGVVKGISVGFRALETQPIATGIRFLSWELLEASVVTIPANASCSIQTVKAAFAASIKSDETPRSSPWREVSDAGKKAMHETRAMPLYAKSSMAAQMAAEAKLVGQAMIKTLAERVEELERELAGSTTRYVGVWATNARYRRGDLVTHCGSIWHCNQPTNSKPGDDFNAWTLAVRRGRDGKDARP